MGDLIERQAAITLPVMPKEHREYQTHNLDDAYEQGWNDLQKCIESLPSAQSEPSQAARDIATILENEKDMRVIKKNAESESCADTISRKAAIDALTRKMVSIPTAGEKDLMGDVNRIRAEDISVIRRLPSAQPEPLDEWCTDCKEYDHERHCCPRWNRVIRQTLKDAQPEIVRCKDCKYYTHMWYCEAWNNSPGFPAVSDEMFCSMAERRTDGV